MNSSLPTNAASWSTSGSAIRTWRPGSRLPTSDLHFEIRQSETARYQFAVTALECGDIDFNQTFLQVDDEACDTEDCWIGDIALDYIPMNLTNMTDGITYEPYDLSQQVHNLVYGWHDEDTGGAYAMMDTVHVAAGTTKIFEFDFTATNDIPIGTPSAFSSSSDNTGNDVWNRRRYRTRGHLHHRQ